MTTRSRRSPAGRGGWPARRRSPPSGTATAIPGRSCDHDDETSTALIQRADLDALVRLVDDSHRNARLGRVAGGARPMPRRRGDRPPAVAGRHARRVPPRPHRPAGVGGADDRRRCRPVHDRPAHRGDRPTPHVGGVADAAAGIAGRRRRRSRARPARGGRRARSVDRAAQRLRSALSARPWEPAIPRHLQRRRCRCTPSSAASHSRPSITPRTVRR